MATLQSPVTVFVTELNGMPRMVGQIEREKISRMSNLAGNQLRNRPNVTRVFYDEKDKQIDSRSVDKVFEWMQTVNLTRTWMPQELTAAFTGGDNATFEDVVKLHATGYYMRISAGQRGMALETWLWNFFHENALTKAQFQMLHEWIPWSRQCKAARDGIAFKKIHGPVPPELEDIEEYLREQGRYDEYAETERHLRNIKASKEHHEAEEQERERKAAQYAAEKKAKAEAEAEAKME